jgi:large subunit ribosomal protein L19
MDVSSLVEIKKNPKIPDIAPGDTVRVSARIVEGGKERVQVFQGVVIKIRRGGNGTSFTVRHVAYGVGVERTFPFGSPLVEKVEIVRQGKVRRSRLYYLRGLSGKEARRKIKRVERKVREQVGEELLAAPPEEVEEIIAEVPEGVVAEAKPEAVAETPVTAPEAEVVPEKEIIPEAEEVKAETTETAAEAEAAPEAEVVPEEKAAPEVVVPQEEKVEATPVAEASTEVEAATEPEVAPEPEVVQEEKPAAAAAEEPEPVSEKTETSEVAALGEEPAQEKAEAEEVKAEAEEATTEKPGDQEKETPPA